jgi:hypothetical protein
MVRMKEFIRFKPDLFLKYGFQNDCSGAKPLNGLQVINGGGQPGTAHN